jgi:Ala-tRNA(Pro) deacylase
MYNRLIEEYDPCRVRSLGREVPVLFNQRTTMRWISGLHDFWYRLTNGLVGGNILGAPILLLTTTGRKSGKRYATPLLYLRDGEDLVVIASNNGSDRDPDWWRNVVASRRANAQVMGKHRDVIAHEATGEERSRLWAEISRRFPIYRVYERRTSREIPVVVLRAADAAGTMRSCREELESYLHQNQVAFQVQHHAVAYTAQEVAASQHISGRTVAKVVMAFEDERLVMLVLSADRRVDLRRTADALGAREVRVAREQDLENTFPGSDLGAMPPFGNLYDLPVYVDRTLAEDETIVCRAGTHTDTISLRYVDFRRLVQPVVADLARHPN